MAKKQYIEIKMRADSLELVNTANDIIEDYQERGFDLTVRQLYYQLVSKDIIPNTEKSYNKLVKVMSNARLAGLTDWDAIVDRTRKRNSRSTWESPQQIIRAVARQYRIDKWEGQAFRPFVWVEKEALAGVVEKACASLDIQADFLSCRGYMSQSTIYREGRNLKSIAENGQVPVVIHLGDHDPSGMDMTRDNIERLSLFSELDEGSGFFFERIALNYDQVQQYNPPPNPAKVTDSRAKGYIEEYGASSWELDALDPDILIKLIQEKILYYQDLVEWRIRQDLEEQQRTRLQRMADDWEESI